MNELQAQIDLLEAEAAQYRRQGNDTKYNEKITEANQLREQLEAQQSEQVKTELIDGLMQQIQDYDIFGVLFPESEYQSVFGLTEYNDKRKDLNQILHAFAVGNQTPLVDKHAAEKQEWAAENRALKDAKFRLEEDVAELEAHLESSKVDTDMVIDDLKNKLAAKDADIANIKEQLDLKQQHIDQLRIDLENAPAPKAAIDVTPVTNQAFDDLLKQTREKSIQSAKDLVLSGNTFRGKVSIVDAKGEPISSGLTPPPVGGSESADSFRGQDSENTAPLPTDTGSVATEVAAGSVEETPTLEQRVAELERAVFGQAKTAA